MSNNKENNVTKPNAPEGMQYVKREVKSGGRVVGTVQVLCYKEDEQGLNVAKAKLTLKDVADLNRQRVTDYMNSERVQREVSMLTKARRAKKEMSKEKQAEFDKKLEALLAEVSH